MYQCPPAKNKPLWNDQTNLAFCRHQRKISVTRCSEPSSSEKGIVFDLTRRTDESISFEWLFREIDNEWGIY
jgi:hypothetical protein